MQGDYHMAEGLILQPAKANSIIDPPEYEFRADNLHLGVVQARNKSFDKGIVPLYEQFWLGSRLLHVLPGLLVKHCYFLFGTPTADGLDDFVFAL